MRQTRIPFAAAVLSVFVLFPWATAPAAAQDPGEALQKAIQLFDGGDYLGAHGLLTGIDRTKLTRPQQEKRDDYLNRAEVALMMAEKALRDSEDAETALTAREFARADSLLRGVLTNQYASEDLRQAATARLRELSERSSPKVVLQATNQPATQPAVTIQTESQPARSSMDPERARVLTSEGNELIKAGRYADAERKFEEAMLASPGFPEAQDGLAKAREHGRNVVAPQGDTLIERIRRQDAINWQRAEAEYRETERDIRGRVAAERFEEANQLLVRARQLVEGGRQFADPAEKYDALKADLEALEAFVRDEERAFHESEVSRIQQDVAKRRAERLRRDDEDRRRQVDALMEQMAQHRKDGDLAQAVEVLKQVIIIDPKNQSARWMMDMLEDKRLYREDREIAEEQRTQFREIMHDVERAKIPWHEQIRYPKDWREINARPERGLPGRSRPDSQLWSALDTRIPVEFRHEPFDKVMERLAEAHRLNVIVNWYDLARAGVERTALIDLSLPREITLKKALTEIIDQAGAGVVDLGFDVADGALTVATQAYLDKKTYTATYDINDLLMTIPKFDHAPLSDLSHTTRYAVRTPSSVSTAKDSPWRIGDDDDDEAEADPERDSRVRQIINLIQETVAPDSWRDRGGSVGTILEINGQIIVTQNSAAQHEINDLLSKLREERAIQIAVEAVFITVSSHYLEELGMNVNLVLNAGNSGFDFIPGGAGPVVDPVLGNRLLLPRQFSRLGFAPNTPALGTALGTEPNLTPTAQPFGQPFLVPQRQGGSGSQLTPVPVRSNILDFTSPTNLASDIPGTFAGSATPALSIFGSFLDNIQVDFLVRATQADSRTSVLTAPKVVVFNGFGAWVAVTISQNFVSTLNPVVAQGAVAQQPVTDTIDAGAVLNIPQAVVTADKRYVMMVLNPGVTRLIALQTFPFSGGTFAMDAFIQLPTLSNLRIQTAVAVPDGGTLLIGGQKLASESEIEAGVPVLSKIPILKRAYSSRSMVKDEQTLLILIKPKILIQSEQEELAFPSFTPKGS